MNRKFLRGVALVSAMALMVTAAGCGNPKKTAKISEDEPLTVSMLYGDNPSAPFNKDWVVLKEIEKRANVKLDIQAVPISDIGDKRKIVFNSGELPDLIGFTWSNDVSEYVGAKIILPISKYENKLPNMMKRIEELNFEAGVNDLRELDGNYYVLPQMNEKKSQDHCLFIRKDIFDKHQMAVPTTYEELYQDMKKLKELYPDSLPFTSYGSHTAFFGALGPAFNCDGVGHPYGYSYNSKTDKWEFVPATENYRKMMEYTVKLSKDGLLDPETFTQDRNQWVQKLVTGKSFVTYGYYGATDQLNKDGRKLQGEDFNLVEILPLAGPDGTIAVEKSGRGGGSSVAIAAAKAEDPNFDRFMKFVDWLYFSDEGISLTRLGVEGLTYQKAADGKYERTPNIMTALNPSGTKQLSKDFGVSDVNFAIVSMSKFTTKTTNPKREEYMETLRNNNWIPDANPTILIKDEDKEEVNILVQRLNDNTSQSIFDFVFEKKSIKDWDKYLKETEDIGYKRLEDILNKNWKENRRK